MSDMMANTLGIKDNDHLASMELCEGALMLAASTLKTNGVLVMKFLYWTRRTAIGRKCRKCSKSASNEAQCMSTGAARNVLCVLAEATE